MSRPHVLLTLLLLFVAGCAGDTWVERNWIRDTTSGKEYLSLGEAYYTPSGGITFIDEATGSEVTLQSYEINDAPAARYHTSFDWKTFRTRYRKLEEPLPPATMPQP